MRMVARKVVKMEMEEKRRAAVDKKRKRSRFSSSLVSRDGLVVSRVGSLLTRILYRKGGS